MKYIDQSTDELRLNVLSGNINKEELQVITSKELTYKNITVDAGIIGASHYISIKTKDETLSEVFACLELTDNKDLLCMFKNHKNISLAIPFFDTKNYKYSSSIRTYDLNDEEHAEDYYNMYDFIITRDPEEGPDQEFSLIYEFPSEEEYDSELKPITYLRVTIYDDNVCYNTIHAYPNENKYTVTSTKIYKNKGE